MPGITDWIGREEAAEDVLTPALAARFHATLALPGVAPHEGEPAPRLIHFCLCQSVAPADALGEDGHPARGGFLPPVALPRRMWAGSEIAFAGDLTVGDHVRRTSRIVDVVEKEGRSGTLCFVTVDHRIDANGATMVRERQSIVYRDAGGAAPPSADAATAGTAVETIVPTPTLLFRYSALTFNGHRIHYDRDYATGVEGYPGLVVHGPLQATLLLHLAARVRGAPPDDFTFRSASPLFDGQPMQLHAGDVIDGRLDLWTAGAGGPVATRAQARWR